MIVALFHNQNIFVELGHILSESVNNKDPCYSECFTYTITNLIHNIHIYKFSFTYIHMTISYNLNLNLLNTSI